MLYLIGSVLVDSPGGLNAQEVNEENGGDFAVKPVVGAQPNREFVGQADTRFSLAGKIYPYRFSAFGLSSGLDELDELKAIAASGEPQLLMRGDFMNLGWFVIEKNTIHSSTLSATGIGREVFFSVNLVSSPSASADGIGAMLDLLFQ